MSHFLEITPTFNLCFTSYYQNYVSLSLPLLLRVSQLGVTRKILLFFYSTDCKCYLLIDNKFFICRTECQEKVLFHQLKSLLPQDVIFLRENTALFQESPRDALISAIRSVLADVLQAFPTKKDEDEPCHEHLESSKQSKFMKKSRLKHSGQDYLNWRRSLTHSLLNIEKCFEDCGF